MPAEDDDHGVVVPERIVSTQRGRETDQWRKMTGLLRRTRKRVSPNSAILEKEKRQAQKAAGPRGSIEKQIESTSGLGWGSAPDRRRPTFG